MSLKQNGFGVEKSEHFFSTTATLVGLEAATVSTLKTSYARSYLLLHSNYQFLTGYKTFIHLILLNGPGFCVDAVSSQWTGENMKFPLFTGMHLQECRVPLPPLPLFPLVLSTSCTVKVQMEDNSKMKENLFSTISWCSRRTQKKRCQLGWAGGGQLWEAVSRGR